MSVSSSARPTILLLAFNSSNQLAVTSTLEGLNTPFATATEESAQSALQNCFPSHTATIEYFQVAYPKPARVFFVQVSSTPPTGVEFHSLAGLAAEHKHLSPQLTAALDSIEPFLAEIPYLHLSENDYIYKFRVEKNRSRAIYQQDEAAQSLYQSKLCEAIKALSRTNERSAAKPAVLNFGLVQYIIPSHFGFCLGVKNAIERAYKSLAENPHRRVFMLSELIHNSFVNEDLLRRGLRYLQTGGGIPFTVSGRPEKKNGDKTEASLWDTLTSEDVVIIPAFGATDGDKRRLIRKGICIAKHDATCMLVEKVWKAARVFGRQGFTIIIHGKSEHEETKATFSNACRYAPCLIIRNIDEARLLGGYIASPSEEKCAAMLQYFVGLYTANFDPVRHLEHIAIVNQTTLLMNETAAIIDYFKSVFVDKYGLEAGPSHVGGSGKKNTLCYATQVNQDSLHWALAEPLDAAFTIGAKNSSNTYQLYRLCKQKLGDKAFFIQSEANIRSRCEVENYVLSAAGHDNGGHLEVCPLWPAHNLSPRRVLITSGASCPDGLIQAVISRINSFFPAEAIRSIDQVLQEVAAA